MVKFQIIIKNFKIIKKLIKRTKDYEIKEATNIAKKEDESQVLTFKDLKKKLDSMNNTVSSIEKKMKKVYGVDVTLPKYNTKDWLTKNKKKRK